MGGEPQRQRCAACGNAPDVCGIQNRDRRCRAHYEQRRQQRSDRLHIRALLSGRSGITDSCAMMTAEASTRKRWADAWRSALSAWSRHIMLRAPQLCATDQDAQREGLTDSFAMIRLVDQSVIINLAEVERRGLADYAVEILAHEIG